MPDPQTRARTAIATALGIAWPASVPLRDGRVWLSSRYDVLPAHLAEALQTYLTRRATDQVRDERILAEAVALVGAEHARSRDELPGLGAAAALDRLIAAPGLDQSHQDEARAMLRVALRSAAEESPEAAARLAAFPGDPRPVSLSGIVAGAKDISRSAGQLGANPSAAPQRRLSRRRTLTRSVDATSLVPTNRTTELTADTALAHLNQLTEDDLGLANRPTLDSGLVVVRTTLAEPPQHLRVEILPTVGSLLAQGRLGAGTPEDPHVLRISPDVADAQLGQIWTHQVSLMTQELAAERDRPKSMLGRLRYAFGPERRDIRLRADFATYQLLSKEWRQAQVVPPAGPRGTVEIQRDLEGLANAIRRRGGALPELPWAPDARSAPAARETGWAVTRLSTTPNSLAALRSQVTDQVDRLESAVADLRQQADNKVTSGTAATAEAAELEGKALVEDGMRDQLAPERARVLRRDATTAVGKAARHAEIATAYRQAADDASHALTGYRDLLTEIDAQGTDPAELTVLAAEAADRAEVYEASAAQAMPVKDLLETGVPTGPPLRLPIADINRVLQEHQASHQFAGATPRAVATAEYRKLLSADGLVLTVGGAPGDDVTAVTQVRLRMARRDFTEVSDRDYDLAEQISASIGAGSQSVGISSIQSAGTSFGVNLQPLLAGAPPGSAFQTASQVLAPRGDVSIGQSLTDGSGVTTHGQFGRVDNDRGESLLYRWTGDWEIEVRNSPTEPWSPAETVAAGEQLTWIQSAYTVKPPAATTTLEALGRGNERNPEVPPHTVTRINGLQDISDRLVAKAQDKVGGIDRVGYDHINQMITSDATRLLHELSTPGGLTRPISVGGQPAYELTLEAEPVWSTAELSGAPTTETWQEAVEVDYTGFNASQTTGTSLTGTAGIAYPGTPAAGQPLPAWVPSPTALNDVGASTVDVSASAGIGRNVSRSGGQSVSSTVITPVVRRNTGSTQGVLVTLKVKATLRSLSDRKADPVVVEDVCSARLRVPENDLMRTGAAVAEQAVLRADDGGLRLDQDRRVLLRGDAEPPTGPQKLPPWHGSGQNQLRGPGKAVAEDLRGADEAQRQALTKLSQLGLVPPLDASYRPRTDARLPLDPLRRAGQLANYDRIVQNITGPRIRAGLNQACQGGIPVTLVDQRTGQTPEYRHYRLAVEQDFNDVTGLGTTPWRGAVRMVIASGATGRSSSRSSSVPLSVGVGAADGPAQGQTGIAGRLGAKLNRSAAAKAFSWTKGWRLNRVTSTESTEPLETLRQGARITFAELTDRGLQAPLADVHGSIDLLYESSVAQAAPPVFEARPKAPDPQSVRAAITVAVDAGNPADRLFTEVPAFRADSTTALQLHAALSSESLVAHPDWMNGSFEVPMLVNPPPSNPVAALRQHTILAAQYKVVLRGRAVSQTFLAITQQDTATVNFGMTDASFTSMTSTSRGGGIDGGAGTDLSAGGSSSRTTGTSQSRSTSRTTGQESILVNIKAHHEFLERYELAADIVDSQGVVVQTVPLDDAVAQKTMPERRALALYASGKLDLPLPVVADVAERYLNDRVTMDPQVAAGFVRRYQLEKSGVTTGLAADHDVEKLVAKLTTAAGVPAHDPTTAVDATLLATEQLAAQRRAVDLGASYDESLGSAKVEAITPDGRPTEQVDLFELVRPQFEQIAPGVLADSKLLAPALRVNLNPDTYQGELENMLGPRGFVTSIEVPGQGPHADVYMVRITARYVGPYTVDGTPEIPAVEAIGLDHTYGFEGADRSVGRSTSYGAGVSGSGASLSPGAGIERNRQTSAGSSELTSEIDRTGHFDLAEVRRTIVFTSEVTRIQNAGAAAMTSKRLGRTVPADHRIAATPQHLTAHATLYAPRKLIREPGTVQPTEEKFEHRPIALTESAVVESTKPYRLGVPRTNELYDVLSAELGSPGVLGAAGLAEHQVTLEGHTRSTAMKAQLSSLISQGGLQLPPFATRGNGRTIVEVKVHARMTGFELAEGPIGDAQTGAVNRRDTSTKSSSTASHLGPGNVSVGAAGGPVSAGASAGQQVKEQQSTANSTRSETGKFEQGELVTVRIPVSYDVTITQSKDNGRDTPHEMRSKQLPNAASGQYFVKMLKHEYLDALRAMETGSSADAALADARLMLEPNDLGSPDLRATEYGEDAGGNQVFQPYQPLLDALEKARQDGTAVVLSVVEQNGHERLYVAMPQRNAAGAVLAGVDDGGFGSAFSGLDRTIALMSQGRVDLRELHNSLSPDDHFPTKVAEALVQNGVPASVLKGLDHSTTAHQLRNGTGRPTPKPVTVGSRPAREQERHH